MICPDNQGGKERSPGCLRGGVRVDETSQGEGEVCRGLEGLDGVWFPKPWPGRTAFGEGRRYPQGPAGGGAHQSAGLALGCGRPAG